jgi:AcrR family transcriptional regulator
MARWEPDARGRLIRAAIDLFEAQGYEATTTAQLAARAGLTKTTFFRHFPDKREVLFAGQATLVGLAASGVQEAPADAGPLEAAAAGVDAMAAMHTEEQRAWGPRLRAVIAANDELRERGTFKRASITAAIEDALVARGVPEASAGVAAELASRAYHVGFDRWTEQLDDDRSLGAFCRAALDELRTALGALA